MTLTRWVFAVLMSSLMVGAQPPPRPLLPKHIVGLKYPRLAHFARVEGEVSLEARIAADGRVVAVRVLSGNGLLTAAAKLSLEQWRFEPCSRRECSATVIFNFVLDQTALCNIDECPNEITVDLPDKITVRSQLARAIVD